MDTRLRFTLNGKPITLDAAAPSQTLLRYLRDVAGLCGTKEGCAEGDCGACSVVLLEHTAGGSVARAVNACLLPLALVHGRSVLTVEGLGRPEALHPVQQAMVDKLGSQCGYCTPGVVMSLLEAATRPEARQAEILADQLSGNLCRCTGYRPIREAAAAVAGTVPVASLGAPEVPAGLFFRCKGQLVALPTSLDDVWACWRAMPEARLINGATDFGLEVTKRGARPPALLGLQDVQELQVLELGHDVWRIGAGVRLGRLEEEARARNLRPLVDALHYFGSRQIKNRATAGGNLCTASPIGDLAPLLLALEARVLLAREGAERWLGLEDFIVGYRKTALGPGEILKEIHVVAPPPEARVAFYKVSRRRELDISALACGLYMMCGDGGQVVKARVAFGGMADRPLRALQAERALQGRVLDPQAVESACAAIAGEFKPISDVRASASYRLRVAQNLLRRFCAASQNDVQPGEAVP